VLWLVSVVLAGFVVVNGFLVEGASVLWGVALAGFVVVKVAFVLFTLSLVVGVTVIGLFAVVLRCADAAVEDAIFAVVLRCADEAVEEEIFAVVLRCADEAVEAAEAVEDAIFGVLSVFLVVACAGVCFALLTVEDKVAGEVLLWLVLGPRGVGLGECGLVGLGPTVL